MQAYRQWVDSQGEEEDSLPGIPLTGTQLFFLKFAQVQYIPHILGEEFKSFWTKSMDLLVIIIKIKIYMNDYTGDDCMNFV